MKFNKAIDQFAEWKAGRNLPQTVRGYSLHLLNLCMYLGNPDIETITDQDVSRWFREMQKLGWSKNSFVQKACAVRTFMEYFYRRGFQVLDPWLIQIPKADFKQPKAVTEDEYKQILNSIPKSGKLPTDVRNEALVRMLWDTGARNGELLSLNVNDLDLDKMCAVIKTEKSRGLAPFRKIMWSESTNLMLQIWLARRQKLSNTRPFHDPDAVFISISNATSGHRMRVRGFSEVLRNLSKRAGLEEIANPHAFRHHFGKELAKKGANNSIISNQMGHSSLASSYRYTLFDAAEVEESYRKYHPETENPAPLQSESYIPEPEPVRDINRERAVRRQRWIKMREQQIRDIEKEHAR